METHWVSTGIRRVSYSVAWVSVGFPWVSTGVSVWRLWVSTGMCPLLCLRPVLMYWVSTDGPLMDAFSCFFEPLSFGSLFLAAGCEERDDDTAMRRRCDHGFGIGMLGNCDFSWLLSLGDTFVIVLW